VNTHWTERLSEYLDGDVPAAERDACEAHLADCAECRDVLGELRAVVAFAASDPDQAAASNLWPGVLSRIEHDSPHGRVRATSDVLPFTARSRAYTFTLPQLALAASLLIAVSAGVAYVAAGRVVPSATALEDPIQAQAEPLLPASAEVERANFADAQYDQAVADLEQILVDMRDELDPRTIVVIERNLSAIDQAIREARAALDGDPANTFLNSHLVDARRKKLELLRRATMISSTSGD
jgi:negative regulator of sigma E activity